jgi:hypothetical protein
MKVMKNVIAYYTTSVKIKSLVRDLFWKLTNVIDLAS